MGNNRISTTYTNAERVAAWRTRNPDKARAQNLAAARKYRHEKATEKPFIGVDGEGAGQDECGRQHYLLINAGNSRLDRCLFDDNRRLHTDKILDFILGLPRHAILVGYFFTYDATQILRDLPNDKLQRLFADRSDSNKRSNYTYYKRYAIDFIPRQYFRVALVEYTKDGQRIVPGSSRTINEVGGFFQKSFVEALKQWNIGDKETLATIGAGKERRSEFTEMTEVEREYCRLECKMLAQLMEKLRQVCNDTDAMPASWRGAGSIAAALYRKHKAPTQKTRPDRPKRLEVMASAAYYGGRFEIACVGRIPGPIYENDINSAYPAAMLKLPCPWHTKWKPIPKRIHPNDIGTNTIYCADISFSHPDGINLCGFPIRNKGRLFWPRQGSGIYWSPEINEAIRNDAEIVSTNGGYYAETKCNCTPYDWVRELYEYRKQLGKSERGFALKLGINALYGKLAQRLGAAPYRDMVNAGLITAFCRAQLMKAYYEKQEHIVMLATDGIFSRVPLALDFGDGLGQWETKVRSGGMFIVQPGIYWSLGEVSQEMPRTRGIPQSRIINRRNDFERIFDNWLSGDGGDDPPTLKIDVPMFVGHRLALARNKPEMAGCWLPNASWPDCKGVKEISFDWGNKRAIAGTTRRGMVMTLPHAGSLALRSQPYDPSILTDLQDKMLETDAAPDWEPWGNSGE